MFYWIKKICKKTNLELNSYFSASGIITFKNSIDLQETFKFLPLDKILIETDSPFLAPVPNRGKKMNHLLLILQLQNLLKLKIYLNQDLLKLLQIILINFFLIKI